MYELLAGIYHKLSGFGPVRWMGEQYLQGLPAGNLKSYMRIKAQKKKAHDFTEPVRVVFIQQNKVNWQIVRNIYEKMMADDRFETVIVAVPEKMDEDPEAAYKSLVSLYGSAKVIRTGYRQDDLFDIRHLKPDYVFLPRPYDQYLPEPYQSKVISEYARVCYMSYSFEITKETEKDVYNGRFFRNVALFFAETKEREQYEKKRYPRSHNDGTRDTVCFGYPSLCEYAHLNPRKDDGFINILWTPRWNDDPALGGSNFLAFKDRIVKYVNEHEHMRLIFRPHPMTFYHFVSTGKMTQDEADRYLAQFDGNRMIYDHSPDLRSSFTAADILITDISSIIVPYVLTGKPMIYCDLGSVFSEQGKKVVSGAHFAHSWDDVENHLNHLLAGNDTKEEQRKIVLDEYMAELKDDHTDEILDYMYTSLK